MTLHNESPTPHKRGRVSHGYVDTHLGLPPDLLQWARQHPEGLGGLVRRLLAAEYARRTEQKGEPCES
jgi:hypothetical protein